ncbi:unnamed protein product [Brassica napus]|uniref:(rape) hypothetical protein n=1 Tax=Brassica napus TaxID=3708 RepID=A0A816XQH3_BRANA|nr:unnamed protein product [Brassica napus]
MTHASHELTRRRHCNINQDLRWEVVETQNIVFARARQNWLGFFIMYARALTLVSTALGTIEFIGKATPSLAGKPETSYGHYNTCGGEEIKSYRRTADTTRISSIF